LEVSTQRSEVSLTIFPFENLSEHRGMEVFCRSFYIDLVTELSRFRQFRISTYQSVQNSGSASTDYIVNGSFRHQNGLLKINAQLINNANNQLAWADWYEGEKDAILSMQGDMLNNIVSSLQLQLNHDLIIHTRKKSSVKFTAYEHWLYGMEELKKGSLEADEMARTYFQQAIEIDPTYSLACSGMSLTYFNEWSCQLWERWDVSQQGAFKWAKKAIDLDEQNHVAALVLGRVYLYEAQYEIAEHYLRRALRLNSNDADNLIQIASCFTFLGYFKEAEELYLKALQLNPVKAYRYHAVGMLVAFEQGQFEKAITLGLKAKMIWVDSPALMAAAYFEVGDLDNMHCLWQAYLQAFQKTILNGGDLDEEQALQWIINVNPYKLPTKQLRFLEFISGKKIATSSRVFTKVTPSEKNYFLKEHDLWQISFEGKLIRATEVKGFCDLIKLLKNPEKQFHSTELMGSGVHMKAEPLFDEKAKRSYQKKILELQEEIRWSENNNDLQRTTTLHKEYDDIVDHLTSSLGITGRIRKSNDTLDKTRSAVTWRIRNAIQKIEKNHPMLGKHLSMSIKTGLFCVYHPEKPIHWITDEDPSS